MALRDGSRELASRQLGPGAEFAPGGVVERVPVPLRWPNRPDLPPDEPRRISEVVVFSLAPHGPDELPVVLDWLLHVWLVASSLDLALPEVLVDRWDGVRVIVPVRER